MAAVAVGAVAVGAGVSVSVSVGVGVGVFEGIVGPVVVEAIIALEYIGVDVKRHDW